MHDYLICIFSYYSSTNNSWSGLYSLKPSHGPTVTRSQFHLIQTCCWMHSKDISLVFQLDMIVQCFWRKLKLLDLMIWGSTPILSYVAALTLLITQWALLSHAPCVLMLFRLEWLRMEVAASHQPPAQLLMNLATFWTCIMMVNMSTILLLSLIHIWRCRRSTLCRSRWSPYH